MISRARRYISYRTVNDMLFIRSLLYNIFGFTTIAITSILLIVTFWTPGSFRRGICVRWCRIAVWGAKIFCGINVEIEGRENIPDEPCVVMLKHTSTFETFWHVTLFPKTVWVIKREILWMPIIGWAIYLALDPIAINRSSGGPAVKQVIRQGKEKLASGIWVSIFPEGTRMPAAETRRYGVSGPALARDAEVMILPVAHNAGDLWPQSSFTKRPGTITIRVGELIDPAGRAPKETNVIVQEWIENQMQEISTVYKEKHAQANPD
jgi:1-acyl-sn-glycerol-3-phosphate acyltransferase